MSIKDLPTEEITNDYRDHWFETRVGEYVQLLGVAQTSGQYCTIYFGNNDWNSYTKEGALYDHAGVDNKDIARYIGKELPPDPLVLEVGKSYEDQNGIASLIISKASDSKFIGFPYDFKQEDILLAIGTSCLYSIDGTSQVTPYDLVKEVERTLRK